MLRVPRAGLLVLLAVAEFMLTLDLSIVNVACRRFATSWASARPRCSG
jgi:hypothetical protein